MPLRNKDVLLAYSIERDSIGSRNESSLNECFGVKNVVPGVHYRNPGWMTDVPPLGGGVTVDAPAGGMVPAVPRLTAPGYSFTSTECDVGFQREMSNFTWTRSSFAF